MLEDFEFFDRTYNLYEYLLNMAIIDVMVGEVETAAEQLTILHESIQHEEIR